MHSVQLLREALAWAQHLGYQIRQQWLDGNRGGACEIHGQKCLLLDITAGPRDQLDQVVETLRREPGSRSLPLSRELRTLLDSPRKDSNNSPSPPERAPGVVVRRAGKCEF